MNQEVVNLFRQCVKNNYKNIELQSESRSLENNFHVSFLFVINRIMVKIDFTSYMVEFQFKLLYFYSSCQNSFNYSR